MNPESLHCRLSPYIDIMKILNNFDVNQIVAETIFKSDLNLFVADGFYCMYSDNYIAGEGYKKFQKWLFNRGILNWRPSFDCDNYAEAFRVFLQIIHSKTISKQSDSASKQSVAFGIIWYTRDVNGGHAINFYITQHADTDKPVLRFIEPQTGQIMQLSESELQSISFALI